MTSRITMPSATCRRPVRRLLTIGLPESFRRRIDGGGEAADDAASRSCRRGNRGAKDLRCSWSSRLYSAAPLLQGALLPAPGRGQKGERLRSLSPERAAGCPDGPHRNGSPEHRLPEAMTMRPSTAVAPPVTRAWSSGPRTTRKLPNEAITAATVVLAKACKPTIPPESPS